MINSHTYYTSWYQVCQVHRGKRRVVIRRLHEPTAATEPHDGVGRALSACISRRALALAKWRGYQDRGAAAAANERRCRHNRRPLQTGALKIPRVRQLRDRTGRPALREPQSPRLCAVHIYVRALIIWPARYVMHSREIWFRLNIAFADGLKICS